MHKKPHRFNIFKNREWIYDFLSALFIFSVPYISFVDYTGFLIEELTLFIITFFSFIAILISFVFLVFPAVTLRIFFVTFMLLLFIDIQFEWIDWLGIEVNSTKLSVLLILVTSLLILWILRSHLSRILTVVFGTMLIVTLGASMGNFLSQSYSKQQQSNSSVNKVGLPVYVHIILDEQIGISGFDDNIPSHKSIKREIIKLFSEYEFRIFGNSYSQYFHTNDSISSILNFQGKSEFDNLYKEDGKNYKLVKSLYFNKIIEKGYDIVIYQSTYMDFCNSVRKGIKKCVTYDVSGASRAALRGLDRNEKATIILSMYADRSFLLKGTRIFYQRFLHYLAGYELYLPEWKSQSSTLGPIPVLPVFDQLIADISSSSGGTMFFAHLLLPHAPYSVDSACQIRRPVMGWHQGGVGDTLRKLGLSNTPLSRLERYEEYIPQVRCALLKIKRLLNALKIRGTLEDAVIIIHSDHGSRIVLRDPRIKNKTRLSRQDYYDGFLSLYVVKSPEITPGYDMRMMALPDLLRDTVSGRLTAPAIFEGSSLPSVFLRGKKKGILRVPMPELPIVKK